MRFCWVLSSLSNLEGLIHLKPFVWCHENSHSFHDNNGWYFLLRLYSNIFIPSRYFHIYGSSTTTAFRHYITVKTTLALSHFSCLLKSSFYSSQTIFSTKTLVKNPVSIATKRLLVTNMKHTLRESFVDGIRIDAQLGHFIIHSVPISQLVPRLIPLYFF